MKATKEHEELLAETSEAQQDYLRNPDADPQELVRRRAYELYEQRGETEGDELNDWFQAEAEVRAALGAEAEEPDEGLEETQQRSAYA